MDDGLETGSQPASTRSLKRDICIVFLSPNDQNRKLIEITTLNYQKEKKKIDVDLRSYVPAKTPRQFVLLVEKIIGMNKDQIENPRNS